VGHHKSGTTALYEMLRGHPQIFMPRMKEPRFLAADLRALVPVGPDSLLPQTLEDYLELFAPARAEQRAGEASPSYLRSATAAATIAELQPQARIVAILREPASFVRSMHLQMLQEHVETEPDLARAVAAEEIDRGGVRVRRYSDHIRYAEQLRRYDVVFDRSQVLVLIYDDFRADNLATVRRVMRHLDVDDTLPLAAVDANPTVRVRSMRVDTVAPRLAATRNPAVRLTKQLASAALGSGTLDRVRRRALYGEAPPVDEGVMLELRRRYLDEVVSLGEYLGRDLVTLWGYGDVN
jgi:hypothetical protein